MGSIPILCWVYHSYIITHYKSRIHQVEFSILAPFWWAKPSLRVELKITYCIWQHLHACVYIYICVCVFMLRDAQGKKVDNNCYCLYKLYKVVPHSWLCLVKVITY